MPVKILFVGDIIGKPGRQALSRELHRLVDRHTIDIVIANGENAAGGFGLTVEVAKELFNQGVHLLTGGNHIWDKKEQVPLILADQRILRPANYPAGALGNGSAVLTTPGGIKVGVLNLEFFGAKDAVQRLRHLGTRQLKAGGENPHQLNHRNQGDIGTAHTLQRLHDGRCFG